MALEGPVLDTGSTPSDAASLPERLVALTELTLPELRAEWRRLYRSQAPRLSRNLMVRAIAYRLQERACGGVSAAVSRKLLEYGRRDSGTPHGRDVTNALPKPGTRLVREWNGRTYTVTITEDGYAYNGSTYGSLTKIARVITGAHWSGPRFFGLNGKQIGGRAGVDVGEPNA
jgi:hypothetical protein